LLDGLGDSEGSYAREVDVSEVGDGCDLPHLGEKCRVVDVCKVVDKAKTRLGRLDAGLLSRSP
jgi:hypothetical protein